MASYGRPTGGTSGFTATPGVSLRSIPNAQLLQTLYGERTFLSDAYGAPVVSGEGTVISISSIIRRLQVALYLLDHLFVDLVEDTWVYSVAGLLQSALNILPDNSVKNHKAIMRIETERKRLRGNFMVCDDERHNPDVQAAIDKAAKQTQDSIEFLRMIVIVEDYLRSLQLDVVKLNIAQIRTLKREFKKLKNFFGIDKYLSTSELNNKKQDEEDIRFADIDDDLRYDNDDDAYRYDRVSFSAGLRDERLGEPNQRNQNISCEDGERAAGGGVEVDISLSRPEEEGGTVESADGWVWKLEQKRQALHEEDYIWNLEVQKKKMPAFIFSTLQRLVEDIENASRNTNVDVRGESIMKKVDEVRKEFVGIGKMILKQLSFLDGVDLALYIEMPVLVDKFRTNLDLAYSNMLQLAVDYCAPFAEPMNAEKSVLIFLSIFWSVGEIETLEANIRENNRTIRQTKALLGVSEERITKMQARVRALKTTQEERRREENYRLLADENVKAQNLRAQIAVLEKNRLTDLGDLDLERRKHSLKKDCAKKFLAYYASHYLVQNQTNIIINGDVARASRGGIVNSELSMNFKNLHTVNLTSMYDDLRAVYLSYSEVQRCCKTLPPAPKVMLKKFKAF